MIVKSIRLCGSLRNTSFKANAFYEIVNQPLDSHTTEPLLWKWTSSLLLHRHLMAKTEICSSTWSTIMPTLITWTLHKVEVIAQINNRAPHTHNRYHRTKHRWSMSSFSIPPNVRREKEATHHTLRYSGWCTNRQMTGKAPSRRFNWFEKLLNETSVNIVKPGPH